MCFFKRDNRGGKEWKKCGCPIEVTHGRGNREEQKKKLQQAQNEIKSEVQQAICYEDVHIEQKIVTEILNFIDKKFEELL